MEIVEMKKYGYEKEELTGRINTTDWHSWKEN